MRERERNKEGQRDKEKIDLNNLGITLTIQGKLDEATVIQREALQKMQQILGDDHLKAVSAMSNLANMLYIIKVTRVRQTANIRRI